MKNIRFFSMLILVPMLLIFGINSTLKADHIIVGELKESSLEKCYEAVALGKKIANDEHSNITFSSFHFYRGELFKFSLNQVKMGHQGYKKLTCHQFVPSKEQPILEHFDEKNKK